MRLRLVLLLASLSVIAGSIRPAGADGEPATKPSAELATARAQLDKAAGAATRTLVSTAARSAIAALDVRAADDVPELHEHAGVIQAWLLARCLVDEVLVYPYEQEKKIDVAYEGGRLPKGSLVSAAELASIAGHASWLLVPRLSRGDEGLTLLLEMYDLKSRGHVVKSRIGPVSTKALALSDICSPEPLPERNVRVLAYSIRHLGRKAARGECADLAYYPIQAAGGSTKGYEFGQEIPWKEGRAGDVVTFGTDGASGGHVVVLLRWEADRSRSKIFHQNWSGNRTVMIARLADVEGSKKGQALRLWRP